MRACGHTRWDVGRLRHSRPGRQKSKPVYPHLQTRPGDSSREPALRLCRSWGPTSLHIWHIWGHGLMDESPLLLHLDLPGRSRPGDVSIQFGAQGPRTWSGVEAELQICLDSRFVAFTSRVNLRRKGNAALHCTSCGPPPLPSCVRSSPKSLVAWLEVNLSCTCDSRWAYDGGLE